MLNRVPAEIFPPGEFIREELEARGWTQGDLAHIMGRPLRLVNELIAGKKQITPIGDSKELLKHVKSNDWNEYRVIARGPERGTDDRIAPPSRAFPCSSSPPVPSTSRSSSLRPDSSEGTPTGSPPVRRGTTSKSVDVRSPMLSAF